MLRASLRAAAAAAFAFFIALLLPGTSRAADVTLLNVSYDPTRELYVDFNKSFAKAWTSDKVTVR